MYSSNEKGAIVNPNIAVLLAAYNGIEWVQEQIDSILDQINVNVDIYISVDYSNDGTYEICKSYANKKKSIHVLPYGDKFGGAAKNFFRLIKDVNIQEYDFIAFSDQDDIWDKRKLSRAVQSITKYSLSAVSSDVVAFWYNGKEKYIKKSWPQKTYDYLFESAGPGSTYVFKEEAMTNFKRFLSQNWSEINNISFHDWLIYAYFRKEKLKWHIDNYPMLRYRQHLRNEAGANYGIQAYLNRIFLFKNKWYRKEVEKINSVLDTGISLNAQFIIKNFWQLRRNPRDAIVLLLMTIFMIY